VNKTLIMTLGLFAAMAVGAGQAFAFSIPVWSAPPIAAPGDDSTGNVNGAVNTHNHLGFHGQDVSQHSR
jgi:hypothetical protein